MGIPFEMITMLGSTVLGGVMSIWSQSIKAKQAQQKMLLQRAEVQTKAFKEAREYENVGFQWTRRIIALTAIFAIVVLPKILPLIDPQAQVIVGYLEFKPGFLFFEGKEVMQWIPMAHRGIIITPLDTNLVAAITGLYFGGSLVKK
ncbi:MAG: hypothetical protein CBD02_04070 [Candidatus Pelagibacter sp. TMED142]|nr:MAG: hypothetical protein CBD02_04070 [Candidatus Pelagibacter sp. TMED142]|tara:strand:- start:429 stop:866 length:438 start_codon:yes stop_codon:yes gene_type:complete